MKEFVELFDSPKFSSLGSSLKLLMVAEGQAHVYPRSAEQDTLRLTLLHDGKLLDSAGVLHVFGHSTGRC